MALAPDEDIRSRFDAATARAAVLESWLDALVATSPTAIGVISAFENRYVRANAALAALYGRPVEAILAEDPFALAFEITHPDELAQEQRAFAELASGAKRSYQLEKRFVRPDGSTRWGHLTFTAILAEAGEQSSAQRPIRFAVVHVVDITEQRATKEALARRDTELTHAQKIDGIGRLAAGIAHDFNNLLTVIIGHGDGLRALSLRKDSLRAAEVSEDLEAILRAADRAATLTAQLLAHGRREPVTPRVFSLSDAVETLERLLVRTIGSDIVVEKSLAARGAMLGDHGQVGQVVMNLMLNARDAMPEGGRITLTTEDLSVGDGAGHDVPGQGEWVALRVGDSGHGMTAEVQARMFEPFFTTREDRPGTQGTGLGLATVKRIVTDLGGQIRVESVASAGTRVSVFFPRTAESPRRHDVGTPRQQPAPAPTSRRVLVVEDEPSVRALVASVLLGAQYRVMVARDGAEALRIIEAESARFDLIVTDLVMPHLGGAKLARQLHERAHRPRMLFISGYSGDTPADLLPYGSFLPKPFTPAELIQAAARALDEPSSE